MATNEQIRDTIGRYIAAFAANDKDGWLALFAADATLEDPVGSEVMHGTEGIAAFWDFSHTLADSIVLEPGGPACVAGREAAFPIHIVSEVGGAKVMLNAIDVMTFTDDARIATMRAYWDMADMVPYPD